MRKTGVQGDFTFCGLNKQKNGVAIHNMEKTVRGACLGAGGDRELSFEHPKKFEMPSRYARGDTELDVQVRS